ncbi:MAG: capsid staple protein [Candidatus Heimdallarchaeaceae archaeon]
MDLVSTEMKRKTKSKVESVSTDYERERWPYGLRLHFDTELIDKLPKLKAYTVGDKITVTAICTVVQVRVDETDRRKTRDITLQTEKIGCEPLSTKPVEKMTPKEYKIYRDK